jgi:hypothetical protein
MLSGCNALYRWDKQTFGDNEKASDFRSAKCKQIQAIKNSGR